MAKVALLMGSKSDFPVVKPAVKVLKDFGVETEVRVISAHRTPDEAHEFAAGAKQGGVEVIICAAGKAAHLGGVIAAYTTLPVIGLPVKTDMMGGSTVSCPSCRCLRAYPSQRWASTAAKTQAFWHCRSSA